MNDCTTMDCGNLTDLYLCSACVSDLQAWIEKAHLYAPELNVTIAKLDVLRSAGNTGGGGGQAGSAAPINLDAVQLQQNLNSVDRDASDYAKDQFAAGIAWTIQDWVVKAERLISGPETEHVDHAANKAQVQGIAPAMPTRELLPWLREKAGISVKGMDIRNWARRGKITPVERTPQPTYLPHEVLAAWHQTQKEMAT